MTNTTDILCIGSVLWDMIGRTEAPMRVGNDVPGRITRLPGGVAMNIAMTLTRFHMHPVLLTAIGTDAEGHELMAACAAMGMTTRHVLRDERLPTDTYMAIEAENGLVAAIADAHSLEEAGDRILAPLEDGTLGAPDVPYPGLIALDGNLTEALLGEIATRPAFSRADLRVAPASPGKATRLRALMSHPGATLYVNLEEAGLILDHAFTEPKTAAAALVSGGCARALVTDGPRLAALAEAQGVISARPPAVRQRRVTGAGDTFMAAHIAAEARGAAPAPALEAALAAAAAYVSGEDPA